MNKPNLPNFLIAGVAKCGTSSLHNYLAQHPQVFMSNVKEPRFITSQFTPFPLNGPGDHKVEEWYVKKYDDYVKLFENANGAIAVGESSADTVYFYKDSIPVIKKYLGDPKIIIVLRNPVKRTCSAYQYLVHYEREVLPFEEALREEPNRIKNNWELIYHYTSVSYYYEAVKAFKDNFSNVLVILNEDLQKNPGTVLQEIFQFLGVDDSVDVYTEVHHNMSGIPKSRWIHNILSGDSSLRKMIRPFARLFLSHQTRERLFNKIQEKNLEPMKIDPGLKKKLAVLFNDDIRKLESLLKKDLSSWLNEKYG
jgi:hypothetical protein